MGPAAEPGVPGRLMIQPHKQAASCATGVLTRGHLARRLAPDWMLPNGSSLSRPGGRKEGGGFATTQLPG